MQQHAGALAGMRFIIDAAAHVMHDGGEAQKPKVRDQEPVMGTGKLEQPRGQVRDAVFVPHPAKRAAHPAPNGVVFQQEHLLGVRHAIH